MTLSRRRMLAFAGSAGAAALLAACGSPPAPTGTCWATGGASWRCVARWGRCWAATPAGPPEGPACNRASLSRYKLPMRSNQAEAQSCSSGWPRSASIKSRRSCAQHKAKVQDYVRTLLEESGYRDTGALAKRFMVLIDGAMVTASRERRPEAARHAKEMATSLLSGWPRRTSH